MNLEKQFATFRLSNLFLGVEVEKVQEVIRFQAMTPVPLAPAAVRGLINLRGQIVTAIELRRRLGLPDRAEDVQPMNVVIRTDDGAVSLLVDEIGDVLDVSSHAYESPPETMDPAARDLVLGVYKLEGELLLVLDVDRAIEIGPGSLEKAA